ncbi:MAG: hypothetical protein IJ019_05680 [Alphaproteobacteria bacterium]|nr:hypothetical protein [Alphaproteobacteria bacterium]
MKYTTENGRSMVEMLGVLAIIGVLSVGGIAGYSKAMNKFKINKTTDQVSMLIANLRTMFSSQGNYAGLDNAQAVNFGIVPDDMYDTCSTGENATCNITNPFGGDVVIKSSPLRAADETDTITTGKDLKGAFYIEYNGLSKEACITLATGDWGSGQSSGLIGMAVNGAKNGAGTTANNLLVSSTDGADGASAIPGGKQYPTPMSVASAVKGCTSANANSVAWKYY